MALVKIIDASGRQWQYELAPQAPCTIGRAPDNCIVLDDPRVSRYHAHIRSKDEAASPWLTGCWLMASYAGVRIKFT